MEKMANQVHQDKGVPLALEEMTVPLVNQDHRESLDLVDSLVQTVIPVIRATQDPLVPKDPLVPPDNREPEETGDPPEREELPVTRVILDHKDCQVVKDHVVTLVRKEKKDCKGRREKKGIRDGLVSLVPLELQDRLVTRATQVLPVRVDSKDPKATEVKTGLTELPAHPDRKDLGEELVCRAPRETGEHLERGATQEFQEILDHRDLLETSALI